MQKKIQIKSGKFKIYGTWDSQKKSDKLAIFVHGFTGSQNEHHYFNAVPFFNLKGFDTFRFNFYSDNKNARSLSRISFNDHVKDLENVVSFWKSKYDELILVGHSLGCLVILNTDLSNVFKIVLWDPTTGFKKVEDKGASYDEKLGKYVFERGKVFVVSKTLVEEWKVLDVSELVKSISVPCKFIFAGNYNKYDLWKPHLEEITVQYDFSVVNGASHGFVEEGTERQLFDETWEWFVSDRKKEENPLLDLVGVGKSKTGRMAENIDEIYDGV